MPEKTTDNQSFTRVELDIFSGQPNPEWKMTEEEATVFHTMLKNCVSTAPAALFDGLGYRGFIIYTKQPTESGEPLVVTIYSGVVKVVNSNNRIVSYCQDTDKKIERWLLGQSRQYIDQDLQRLIETSLNE